MTTNQKNQILKTDSPNRSLFPEEDQKQLQLLKIKSFPHTIVSCQRQWGDDLNYNSNKKQSYIQE